LPGIPYSTRIPGITNPRLLIFIVSTTSAMTSATPAIQCHRVSGASSGATIRSWKLEISVLASLGRSPYSAAAIPPTISPIPHNMPVPIGIPAIW